MTQWECTLSANKTLYSSKSEEPNPEKIKIPIEAAAEKATSLLRDNILDDSLYLIFEWNPEDITLTVSVTDADKAHDSDQRVCCEFPAIKSYFSTLDTAMRHINQLALTDSVKFWLHDYLTTCTAFFKFSLVAIFHASSRNDTELL